MSLHQIELVRQWSAAETAFVADLGPLDADAATRLDARGIRLVTAAVTAVEDGTSTALRVHTADGAIHDLDALFVTPAPSIRLDALAALKLARTEAPGGPLAVDMMGATSHPRVWAAGNAMAPFGNVPLAMGSGAMAGAGANASMVAEDAARAVTGREIA